MKKALLIAARDVRAAFSTPLAYVMIAGFCLLSAFFFFSLLANFNAEVGQAAMRKSAPNLNEAIITPFFSSLQVVLVFMIPLLTMRSIAEEKRSGTFEMLATSPVSNGDIVLGKYLSTCFITAIMLLFSFAYPLCLAAFADPETPPALIAACGTMLFAFSLTGIGIAVSAFSRSQTVAGIVTLVLLLLFYVLDAPAPMLPRQFAGLLRFLAPSNHMELLLKGVVTGTDIFYFCTLLLFGLFLANRALDGERWH